MRKKLYLYADIQKMIQELKADEAFKEQIISKINQMDQGAVRDVISDGSAERFDRYDSAVCENFVAAYERVKGELV